MITSIIIGGLILYVIIGLLMVATKFFFGSKGKNKDEQS